MESIKFRSLYCVVNGVNKLGVVRMFLSNDFGGRVRVSLDGRNSCEEWLFWGVGGGVCLCQEYDILMVCCWVDEVNELECLQCSDEVCDCFVGGYCRGVWVLCRQLHWRISGQARAWANGGLVKLWVSAHWVGCQEY